MQKANNKDISQLIDKITATNPFILTPENSSYPIETIHDMDAMPIAVYFATVDKNGNLICIGNSFPESKRIYFELDNVPAEKCYVKRMNWIKKICVSKTYALELLKKWYPTDAEKWDYIKTINMISGNAIWIVGYGD